MLQVRDKKILFLVFIVLFLFTLLFLYFDNKRNKESLLILEKIERESEFRKEIENLGIVASAISIYDVTKDEKIFGKNDSEHRPLASLIKTLTVITALENQKEKDITISKNALNQNGDYGFRVGEVWDIEDLAKFTMILSANDGAYALSENIPNFLENLNTNAKKLQMKSNFANVTGLDIDKEKGGAYGSALDANKMAIYLYKNWRNIADATTLKNTTFKSKTGFIYNIENTNLIVDQIPNLLFSKTGYTDVAGGNLSIIFKNKYDQIIAITILGSTKEGRFLDMGKLVDFMYNTKYEK